MVDKLTRRRLVASSVLGAGAALAVTPRSISASTSSLAVYLHCDAKPWALNKALSGSLPGTEVTVYGRFRDFSAGVKGATVAMAIRPVIAHYGLPKTLTGVRAGKTEESYALIGVGVAPDPAKVTTLGVLDLLGRSATNSFVRSLLSSSTFRVRRVTKVEDLLPLLLFKYVDAILAPTSVMREFKTKTDADLQSRKLSKSVGLPTVAALGSGSDRIVTQIRGFGASVNGMLGVETWR